MPTHYGGLRAVAATGGDTISQVEGMADLMRSEVVVKSTLGNIRSGGVDFDSGSFNPTSETYNSKNSTAVAIQWIILLPPQLTFRWKGVIVIYEYRLIVVEPYPRARN